MPIEEINTASEVLNSWKEIAAYLNRGVRTVQRWETALSLPVRRPRGKQRSAVIAMRSELDGWLRSCPLQEIEQTTENGALPRAVGRIRVPNGNPFKRRAAARITSLARRSGSLARADVGHNCETCLDPGKDGGPWGGARRWRKRR